MFAEELVSLQKEWHSFPFSNTIIRTSNLRILRHSNTKICSLPVYWEEGKHEERKWQAKLYNSFILSSALSQQRCCLSPTCPLLPDDIQAQNLCWHYSLKSNCKSKMVVSCIILPDRSQFRSAQLGSKHGDFTGHCYKCLMGCESLTKLSSRHSRTGSNRLAF